jgi:hypothetical protein
MAATEYVHMSILSCRANCFVTDLEDEKTEGVRFELTRPFGLPVFKTGAINRSATPPRKAIELAKSVPSLASRARATVWATNGSQSRYYNASLVRARACNRA